MPAVESIINQSATLPESAVQTPSHSKAQTSVRVRLDEPCMEAAIRATAVYCASIAPDIIARRKASEAFLVKLLRSRLRLVRAEMLRRKLEVLTDEERSHYQVRRKSTAYSQIYFSPTELAIVKNGLDILSRRLQGDLSEAERRLAFRCTTISQAIQAGKNAHSELVRALNSQRRANVVRPATPRNGNPKQAAMDSAVTRMRFREWTVRAGVFASVSYMWYKTSAMFWERAYGLLERLIRLQRDVIVSQVRHGKPGHRLREGGVVARGLGIESNKQAYITPRFNIEELWVLREGLELREREVRLNPTERVLLLKAKLLEGAKYGDGRQQLGWRLGGLAKRKRYGVRARL